MKFIAYFTHEEYGYYEFEAKNKKEAYKILDKFNCEANFPDDLTSVKDNGWEQVDLDIVKEDK